MLFKTFSAALFDIDAYVLEVEGHVGPGEQGIFNVAGPPDVAAKESRELVIRARQMKLERFHCEKGVFANSQMPPKLLRKPCAISAAGEKPLETAIAPMGLSARAHDRILKVSRTIADLAGAVSVEANHLSDPVPHARPLVLGVNQRPSPLEPTG